MGASAGRLGTARAQYHLRQVFVFLNCYIVNKPEVMIGSASCGIAAGARQVEEAALEAVKDLDLDAVVSRTGCVGFCQREPLVDILPPDGPRITYANMTAKKIRRLLEAYASDGDLKPQTAICRFEQEPHLALDGTHAYPPSKNGVGEIPVVSSLDFFAHQQRTILRNCGSIDPLAFEEAVARGAYRGAVQALTRMTPEEIVGEMERSGLRGRAGARWPTRISGALMLCASMLLALKHLD